MDDPMPETATQAATRAAAAKADAAEVALEAAQIARDQAAQTLRASTMANDQAAIDNANKTKTDAANLAKLKADNKDAASDKLASELKDAIPKFSDFASGSVALPPGAAFRSNEVLSMAVDDAADALAAKVAPQLSTTGKVLVTSDPSILHALVAYAQIGVSLSTLEGSVKVAIAQLGGQPASRRRTTAPAAGRVYSFIDAGAATAVAGAAVDAFKEVASLFVVDSTVHSATSSLPDFETQVAVIGALRTTKPTAALIQETARRINPDSPLLTRLNDLAADELKLAKLVKQRSTELDGLPKTLNAQQKRHSATLTAQIAVGKATIDAVTTFTSGCLTAPEGGGASPIVLALQSEDLEAESGDFTQILIVPGATLTADQVAIKRRLFNPRVVVTGFAQLSYALIDFTDGTIIAAGKTHGIQSFTARFGTTVRWMKQPAISDAVKYDGGFPWPWK
jgi:hypothetical protein